MTVQALSNETTKTLTYTSAPQESVKINYDEKIQEAMTCGADEKTAQNAKKKAELSAQIDEKKMKLEEIIHALETSEFSLQQKKTVAATKFENKNAWETAGHLTSCASMLGLAACFVFGPPAWVALAVVGTSLAGYGMSNADKIYSDFNADKVTNEELRGYYAQAAQELNTEIQQLTQEFNNLK